MKLKDIVAKYPIEELDIYKEYVDYIRQALIDEKINEIFKVVHPSRIGNYKTTVDHSNVKTKDIKNKGSYESFGSNLEYYKNQNSNIAKAA